jgi:hypothetical protein
MLLRARLEKLESPATPSTKGANVDDDREDGLGGGLWLKFIGVLLLGAIGSILVFVLIANAWAKWGLFGGILFFGAILLAIAWVGDRRSQRRYEDVLES